MSDEPREKVASIRDSYATESFTRMFGHRVCDDIDAILALFEQERAVWNSEREELGKGVNHWHDRAESAEARCTKLVEALSWLVHLHHGISKGGEETSPPSEAEWKEALDSAVAVLALVKQETPHEG